ncbi:MULTISPECIES: hypothetical protein [Nostocales]|nr:MULTISPECIES: hypothetical protein [Nostocales]
MLRHNENAEMVNPASNPLHHLTQRLKAIACTMLGRSLLVLI